MMDVLEQLRDRCLCYAAGYVPTNRKSRTISHSLWKQSPFAATDWQVDLAASGFSLAALPVAVERGLLTWENGCAIATDAAARVREMVRLSARAETEKAIAKYGCDGMLYHFYRWDYGRREFVATRAVERGVNEVSSIDTALLMWGLLTCGSYFGGVVAEDYAAARDRIIWHSWFDAGRCQFRRAYYPGRGFEGWWDWYTQEAMLISLLAAMSDPQVDATAAWRGWTRELRTYTSPSPEERTFQCYATWNGDPFTVAYGMAFLDLARFSRDLDGIDWFRQGQIAYEGHVEFFRKERGYLDGLVLSAFSGPGGVVNDVVARPSGSSGMPVRRTAGTVYGLACGLGYYRDALAASPPAQALAKLVGETPGFYAWHGWPVAVVDAMDPGHPVESDWIVGQDISFMAVAIENCLTGRIHDLVLKDLRLRVVLDRIFPEFRKACAL